MMKKVVFLVLIAGYSILAFNQANESEDQLLAGTAKVNITPLHSELPIHDSIYARSLVLEGKGVRVAMISMDLGGYTNPNLLKYCEETYGIEHLLLCPSHTHSSRTDRDSKELEDKMMEVIDKAVATMVPVRISAGHRTFPQLGFNRLIIREDGHAREPWFGDERFGYINYERIPFGPVDPAVGIIKFEDTEGQARAIIMNYACHTDIVWGNYEISADYVGVACGMMEEAFDHKANCLFVEGAAGNIAPLFKTPGRSGPDDPFPTDYTVMERMGFHLGSEAIKLAKSLYPDLRDEASVKIKSDSLRFSGRFDKTRDFNVHLATILINDHIAIATVPGEPFIKFQLDWKEEVQKQENVTPFFFGYTWTGGTWPGYIPDIRGSALGGYGADQSERMIEIGAGEKMVDKHLENFYIIHGLMREEPSNSDYEHGTRYLLTPVEPIQPSKRSNSPSRPVPSKS